MESTFAVHVTVRRSRIDHTHFAALKVKDAVVDQFRERFGSRPSILLERPDIRLNVHVERKNAVDLSKTYLAWARRNLELNGISVTHHGLIQADCVHWIKEAGARESPSSQL